MPLNKLSRSTLAGVASLLAVVTFVRPAVADHILSTYTQAYAQVWDPDTETWIDQYCEGGSECATDLSAAWTLASFGSLTAGASATQTDFKMQSWADAQAMFEDAVTIGGHSGQGFIQFSFFGAGEGQGRGEAELLVLGDDWTFSQWAGGCWGCMFQTGLHPFVFDVPFGFSVTALADAMSDGEGYISVDLTDVLILDANGQPIPGLHLTSESGTVYRLDPRNAGIPTPEPGILILLGTGIGLIAGASRLRKTGRD